MPVIPEGIAYAYTHETTQATTGYFSCQPPASLTLPQALARLEATPFDDFLRQHCLRQLSRRSPEEIKNLADELYDRETDSFRRMGLAGLLLECSLLVPELAHCCDGFPEDALQRLTLSSSLIYLRAASRKDFGLMQAWSAHFADNIARHHMLPHWEELELELPYSEEELEVCREGLRARAGILEREHARMQAEDLPRLERRPAQETYEQAVNALLENDVLAGQEMRHQASLSPIALLRSWKVDLAVDCGRMRHSLRGEATAYGRGLSLAAARASYAMEIVERASSYVSVARTGEHTFEVTNRRRPMPLIHASCAKLRSQGKDFLPLSSLPLETPFEDYVPLYWLEARDPEGKAVLVPAQAVFLFCNLDEQSLFLAGGSTGLASGNTEAEARLAALTEIVERDAEATTPFSREGCFVLKSRDERLQALLDDYAARGIQIQFQDITTELGVPVYRCFVMSRRGGTGHGRQPVRQPGRAGGPDRSALALSVWRTDGARSGRPAGALAGRSARLQSAVGRSLLQAAGKDAVRPGPYAPVCGHLPQGSGHACGACPGPRSGTHRRLRPLLPPLAAPSGPLHGPLAEVGI